MAPPTSAAGTGELAGEAAVSQLISAGVCVTLVAIFACVAVGAATRRVRRRRPWAVRLGEDVPVWPTAAALLAGILTFFFTGGLVGAALAWRAEDAGDLDVVVSAAAGSAALLAGTAAAVAAHELLRRSGLAGRLGLAWRDVPPGLAWGVVASAAVMPVMMAGLVWFGLLRRWLGHEDQMHGLLEAVQRDPTAWRLIASGLVAVVAAPLAEEVLFRGLLQPACVYGLWRLTGGGARPTLAVRLAGVTAASVPFMLLHEPWSWPPIFGLSLLLGLLYERTGNLWSCVVVHGIFNATSLGIVVYVTLRGVGAG